MVGVPTFAGLLVLGAPVDPVFSRYAVLLAVIAGILELLPMIGPIISAIPAVVLGATAGIPGIVAALVLYFAVQQVENNFLVPKVQGDATNLHPAVVLFALILGGAIAGLRGAILALPVAATARDLYVYAFRRAGGLAPEQAATGDARPAADTGPQDLRPTTSGSPTRARATWGRTPRAPTTLAPAPRVPATTRPPTTEPTAELGRSRPPPAPVRLGGRPWDDDVQHDRRHHRGEDDGDEHGAEQLLAEEAEAQPERDDHDPHLAPGRHADADGKRAPAAGGACPDQAAEDLRDDPDDGEDHGGQREARIQQRTEIELGPGDGEEERREDRGQRLDLVLDLVLGLGSATIRPATKAPMIAARPMKAARIARPSISMKAGTSGVSAKRGQVNTSRRTPRARRAIAKPSATKPSAPTTRPRVATERSPSAAPETIPMRMSASTSSMTAAPMMMRLNRRSRTPRSARTRDVIPMLVAARARPTNAAVAGSSPVSNA